MATPRKKPEDKLKTGRPTDYDPAFCDQLINHMRGGGSFESFGGVVRHNRDTLYEWTKVHPEFSDAKKIGTCLSLLFYENMGKAMATGQIKRVKSEKPLVIDGKLQHDKNGDVIYEREYEYTTGGQTAWKFMLKNMHRWRDSHDVEITGKGGGPIQYAELTDEQLQLEIDKLIAEAEQNRANKKK